MLVRARKQLPGIAAALRRRDVPVEVVGLGGLLEVPEVSDVVATLTVLVDPTAGDALGRLLTGARWRIGPRDLAALEARARSLVHSRRPPAPAEADEAPAVETPTERGSIVEALDDLGGPDAYSTAGYRRLRRLGGELAHLRNRIGESLPDLVDEVARTLGLETELASAPGVSPAGARAHLDALHGVAAEFTELAELPSLPAFLGYLRDAEERERGLEPGEVAVNPEAVQLLTGHSAKGLEWDVVAVPGMTTDQFPAKTDTSDSWVKDPGAVPADLRLTDREELPRLRLPVPGSGDQAVVKAALEDYVQEWKDFGLAEEIRLGYVAVTRARHLLVCSGSWWRDGVRPCGPSSLLTTARAACEAGAGEVVHWAEPPADDATNPALEEWPVGVWPADPLSSGRRRALTAAAELVDAAAPHPLDPETSLGEPDDLVEQWVRDADLLLRERARHASPTVDVPLPSHLSVSALVALRRDPGELARRLRRPMPAAPAPQARRGTAFHAWLEERFGAARLVDLDELPGSGDEFAAPDGALAGLQEAFLASEWAERQPIEVEVPFETPLGPLTLRGRIDAVFADADGRLRGHRLEDRPAAVRRELAAAAVQLAAYRLGWSRLTGVPVEQVSAGFHHVAAGRDPAAGRPARRGRPARPGHRHRRRTRNERGTRPGPAAGRPRPGAGGRAVRVRARPDRVVPPDLRPFATVDEDEGLTLVVPRADADRLGLAYDYVAARITLRVHSDPAAVGMTAAFSRVLADGRPELQRDRRLLPRPPAGAVGPGRRGRAAAAGAGPWLSRPGRWTPSGRPTTPSPTTTPTCSGSARRQSDRPGDAEPVRRAGRRVGQRGGGRPGLRPGPDHRTPGRSGSRRPGRGPLGGHGGSGSARAPAAALRRRLDDRSSTSPTTPWPELSPGTRSSTCRPRNCRPSSPSWPASSARADTSSSPSRSATSRCSCGRLTATRSRWWSTADCLNSSSRSWPTRASSCTPG